MHGFTHTRPVSSSLVSFLLGHVDEMAGLDTRETATRLVHGQRILTELFGVSVKGFLPPAWRMGCVDLALAEACNLEFLVGYHWLQYRAQQRLSLMTTSWDWGPIAAFGRLGPALARMQRPTINRLAVIALHPCDEERGYLSDAIDEIKKLLDHGYAPTTFDNILKRLPCETS